VDLPQDGKPTDSRIEDADRRIAHQMIFGEFTNFSLLAAPARFMVMPRSWLWGVVLGVLVGGGVILGSSLRYGFSAPLLVLGLVLLVVFGAVGLVGDVVGRRTNLD